jgi:hypothetical protein
MYILFLWNVIHSITIHLLLVYSFIASNSDYPYCSKGINFSYLPLYLSVGCAYWPDGSRDSVYLSLHFSFLSVLSTRQMAVMRQPRALVFVLLIRQMAGMVY